MCHTSRKRNGCLDAAGGDGDGADSFSVMEHHLSDQHRADTPVKVPHISHDETKPDKPDQDEKDSSRAEGQKCEIAEEQEPNKETPP